MRLGLGFYALDETGEPVSCGLDGWSVSSFDFTPTIGRRVARDVVGDCEVSTMFLGLDHNYGDAGEPVLWETRVFSETSSLDREQWRCSGKRADARAMHDQMVARVTEFQKGETPRPPEPAAEPTPHRPFGVSTRSILLPR